MAIIKNKFLFYQLEDTFLADLAVENKISQQSIAFIKDKKYIWSHGVTYHCDFDASDINGAIEALQAGKLDKTVTINDVPVEEIKEAGETVGYSFTLTKENIGLGNVDNTADADKPISTATQTALDAKLSTDTTINGVAAVGDAANGWTFTLTKADLGLGNVDNTSDADKPVSIATQAALDLKVNTADVKSSLQAVAADGATAEEIAAANENRNKPINTIAVEAAIAAENTEIKGIIGTLPADAESVVDLINNISSAGEIAVYDENGDQVNAIHADGTDYVLKQGETTIATMNFAIDSVTEGGEVVTGSMDGGVYSEEGDDIFLKLNIRNSDPIYIPADALVDVYTTQTNATQVQLTINDNVISAAIVAGSITKTELSAAVVTEIENATSAIAILNGDASTEGSVAKAITDAKGELIGTNEDEAGASTIYGANKAAAAAQAAADLKVNTDDVQSAIVAAGNEGRELPVNSIAVESAIAGKLDRSEIFKNGVFDTSVTKANGTTARILNESDGGGCFITDGTANVKAYVGVNEGGASGGLFAQLYAKDSTTNVGARLNVSDTGIFYTNGKTNGSFAAGDELVVKSNLTGLATESYVDTAVEGVNSANEAALAQKADIDDVVFAAGAGLDSVIAKRTSSTDTATAAGDFAASVGQATEATGNGSFASGIHTTANNIGEAAVGIYNSSFTGESASAQTTFSVGIGVQGAPANGFEVRKDGAIYLNYSDSYVKLQDILDNEFDWYEA